MSYADGVLKRSANWHHKQAQRTAYFDRERPIAAVTLGDKAEAYMRFSANLLRLKSLDRAAWDTMNDRMDVSHESWQSVDVDICNRLSDFDEGK